MNKPLLGICAGVAVLLLFLILAIFAIGKNEIVFGILYICVGCVAFMAGILYAISAKCRRRDKRDNIILCNDCENVFVKLAEDAKACPGCGSNSLVVVE